MWWFWILIPVLFVIVWLVLMLEWNKYKYRKFHGDSPVPIFGNALHLGFNSYDILQALTKFSNKYDRLFRLFMGPTATWVVLYDPDDIEVILTNQKNITKGDVYGTLKSWLGKGLLTSTGEHWHRHRKLLTPSFHFGILERFVEVFEKNGEILVNKLSKEVGKSSFDVYNYVTLCALDNMIDATMGVSLNVQINEESKYLRSVREVSNILLLRMFQPWISNDNIFKLTANGKLHDQYIEILHSFTEDLIQKRKSLKRNSKNKKDDEKDDEFSKKRLALLDLLLDIQEKDPSFTDVDVREETDTFVFEGHDTTTSAISFCLYNISKYPDVQEKIIAELDTIFDNKKTKATYRDLQNMVYLEKVIKESLRVHPSVPTISRLSSTDIYLKDNLMIPKGTEVALFFGALGKNPKIWPDPERFDPERFDTENSRSRHPFAFSMFSAGPRNCIGQKFAMLEIKSTVSTVLRNFVLKDAGHELKLANDLTLKSVNGVLIALEKRI